jgi:hypothetical protein
VAENFAMRIRDIHLPRIEKFVLDHLSATPVAAAIDRGRRDP